MHQHSHGCPLPPSTNPGLSPFPPAAALRFCTWGCRALHSPTWECVLLSEWREAGEADKSVFLQELRSGQPGAWDLKGRRWAVSYSSINTKNKVSLLSANVESRGLPTKSQELIFVCVFFFKVTLRHEQYYSSLSGWSLVKTTLNQRWGNTTHVETST